MVYLLDAMVILIFVLCIWLGHHNGFIKSVSKLVAFAAAAILAFALNAAVAGFLYDRVIAPPIISSIDEETAAGTQSLSADVDKALGELPGFITNYLDKHGISGGADVTKKLTGGTQVNVGEKIAGEVLRPVLLPLIKMIAFVLLFLILMIVCLILLKLLDKVFSVSVLKTLNKSLGTLIGILNGLIWVIVYVSVLQILAASGKPDAFINDAMLGNTILVKNIILLNPLGKAMQVLWTKIG